jgi:hypothetical protein
MPKPKPDDPAQSKRFLKLAKELDADADERDLEASVRRLGKHAPEPRRRLGKKGGETRHKRATSGKK